ncbi:methylenetetrahydrofolate reductase [NAD(P)H] [Mameliella sediminis]|uniref:methylenetetrahydrofolate reductase [NAD(P)H] n=1 Tax=Mameliella sediminis TaxID=2836866 RepID=UPI001C47E797|nr:methylenetetrahydrofolate reductase [NAD(P)H] [Mameliella sediminis]MBV7393937.1 methylenetetrahydrofolate reductase [NAD(P)H] [Mameliella sediminis]MBY6115883.1 methylenetetrahydrofolate reductase [NAD(P)H] [Antarctobacter heliothermus]MBY6145339.1 methylenetetrahydrofolate reductase [NAD(P)H] [Mameliella alba]MCA0955087.1 methylenetetrahydrofolate reductase [NAD(P)H] [Mameliella alba]
MQRPEISFEFFPPKNIEATFRLWDAVQVLGPLAPRFVSVTYGAGGTTRDLTRDVVATLHRHSGLRTAAHLTCVNATRAETLAIAEGFAEAGVTDIVALRGDPPKGAAGFAQHPDGFANSIELIEALAQTGRFALRVGAYPDCHPEAASQQANIDWLKRKLDAGAEEALTQFFFEAETFFRFRDACAKAGIDGDKLVPGILPIENWNGARRFAESCGTHIPTWVSDAFEKAQRDGREDLLATAICTELCSDLLEQGVDKLHFYTLNRPELTRDVCFALGVTPEVNLERVA